MSGESTVLVTVDSLRYDYVFGNRRDYDLPNIDRLADEGTVFDRAYTTAPYTTDSFTSILGGTYPWRYGTSSNGFEDGRPHVVEPFVAAGYDTLGVYCNPYLGPSMGYDRGFDRYVEGDDGNRNPLHILRNVLVEYLPRDTVLFQAIRSAQRKVSKTLGSELEGRPYADAAAVNDTAREFLETTSGPVFLWLHYMDVHSPFYPHDDTLSEGIDESEAIRTFYDTNMRPRNVSDSELQLLGKLYAGEVQYLDRKLGDLLDIVDREVGLNEATILFTSDHGEAFDEHGFCFHPKELYEELVRIPMVLRTPESDSTSVATPVSNVDVLPTLVADAGLPVPNATSGRDLRGLIAEDPVDRHVFSHAIDEANQKVMVCDGEYKLIRDCTTDEEQMFDLADDPGETENCISDDRANRFRTELQEHLATMDTATENRPDDSEDIPESLEEQLRDLGYR